MDPPDKPEDDEALYDRALRDDAQGPAKRYSRASRK